MLLYLFPKCHQNSSSGYGISGYYNLNMTNSSKTRFPTLDFSNWGCLRNLTIWRLICSVFLQPPGGPTQARSNLSNTGCLGMSLVHYKVGVGKTRPTGQQNTAHGPNLTYHLFCTAKMVSNSWRKIKIILFHDTKWWEVQILVSINKVLLEHSHIHLFMVYGYFHTSVAE